MNTNIDWEAAINNRRSVRSYQPRPVEEAVLSDLKRFADELRLPVDQQVRIRFFKADPGRRLYNSLRIAPPDNAAFIARTDPAALSAAGFAGELLILYATTLGLATCWYGHYSLAELERALPDLKTEAHASKPKWGYGKGLLQGERAICVTPLGYWQKEGGRLMDRITESWFSYKRKPIGAFLEGGVSEAELPPELLFAFDLARKAPSAANSQHWRFMVAPGLQRIAIAMPTGYQHIRWEHPDVDIGCCASHFWLGLTLQKVACQISLREEQGRAVWRFEL